MTLLSHQPLAPEGALDFISRMVPHIPPKGMQMVRYAGLYARNVKRKLSDLIRAALATTYQRIKWRECIKKSFGYDPLQCTRCGRTLELAEIWELKGGHIWMKRWLETHRLRKAARLAMQRLRVARSLRYHQLAFNFDP